MPKKRSLVLIAVWMVLFFSSAAPALGAKIIGDDYLTISKPVNDDLYLSGGEVSVDARINGDLFVAGGLVRIDGDVQGDLFVIGGEVRIDGDVQGDLFIVAGDAKINGRVGDTARVVAGTVRFNSQAAKDMMVLGGEIDLDKRSRIGRDLFAAAGSLRSAGEIGRNLKGTVGNLLLSGKIGRNVNLHLDNLRVTEKARVGGNLRYTSDREGNISPEADVGGKVTMVKRKEPTVEPLTIFVGWLWGFLGMLAVGLVVAWLLPRTLKAARKSLESEPFLSLGLGFGLLFLTPILMVMLVFTLIGIPLSLILLGLYLIAIYLAQVYGAAALGAIILEKTVPSDSERWVGAGAVVGIFFYSVIKLLPILGGLLSFLLVLFGLGSMALAYRQQRSGGADKTGAAGGAEDTPAPTA